MGIDGQDCRIEGATDGATTSWFRATHLPTGVVAQAHGPGGMSKRALMERLQRAVDAHEETIMDETPTARTIRMVMEEAAARERERCASVAERVGDELREYAVGGAIAKAIRAAPNLR